MRSTGSTAAADVADSSVYEKALTCAVQELADLLPTVEAGALRCLRLMQGINGLERHLDRDLTHWAKTQNACRAAAQRLIEEAKRKRRSELGRAAAAVDPSAVSNTGTPTTRD